MKCCGVYKDGACLAELDPNDNFCYRCGAANNVACDNCKESLKPASNFCTTCSHPVVKKVKKEDKPTFKVIGATGGSKVGHMFVTGKLGYTSVDSTSTQVIGLDGGATAQHMFVAESVKDPAAISTFMRTHKLDTVDSTLMERFKNPDKHKVYNMKSKPRGLFYVINNVNFENKRLVRTGSNIDSVALKKLFTDFGFDVEEDEDLTAKDMKAGFSRQVKRCMKTQYNCFAAAVLSHGKNGGPLGTDHELLETEDIMAMFNGNNCSGLSGKPKLFFIQACQGVVHDPGAPVTDANVETINEELINKFSSVQINKTKSDDKIPTEADFFLAVATVGGYVSYRRTDMGSHFIQAMVKVFREYAATDTILNLMPKVNQEVQEKWSQEKFFQVAKSVNTMMKEFYFFPLSDFPSC